MRAYLIAQLEARPFVPFTVLMHGGFGIDLWHPEFIVVEPGVLHLTVYDPTGHRQYLDVEKIVAIRTIHPVEE